MSMTRYRRNPGPEEGNPATRSPNRWSSRRGGLVSPVTVSHRFASRGPVNRRFANQGFTLVEMLVAITIFAVVMSIVTAGMSSILRSQGLNEAATSSQAKLRRVTEVFTQELRSAVLGGITNQPYQPNATQISFMLLDGGAGYQVQQVTNFHEKDYVKIIAPVADAASLGMTGGQALMVDSTGVGTLFDVSSVTGSGVEYTVFHSSCLNGVAFQPGSLLFQVQTLGFQWDDDSGTLYEKVGNADAVPMAFDIESMRLDFVYDKGGTPVVQSAPALDGTTPLRTTVIDGVPATLARVRIVLGANVPTTGGSTVSRTFSGVVEMPTNQYFTIERVRRCA